MEAATLLQNETIEGRLLSLGAATRNVEGEDAVPWEEQEGLKEKGEKNVWSQRNEKPSSGLTSERDETCLRTWQSNPCCLAFQRACFTN
jgi:hypothetical protein